MIPMLKDIIPITSNNLIFTLFSSFEAIILPTFLFQYYNNADTSMEMYGIITGIVIPFLLFRQRSRTRFPRCYFRPFPTPAPNAIPRQ